MTAPPKNSVPAELVAIHNWLVWREERTGDGKLTKKPYRPRSTRVLASSTDSATWTTYSMAASAANADSTLSGVGFVFTKDLGITGVDLDACIDPETGKMEPWAKDIVARFDTYTEYSPSGTGVKLWCYGDSPHNGKKNVHPELPAWPHGKNRGVEMYDTERYFTVTGERFPGTPFKINARQKQLDELADMVWPEPPSQPRVSASPQPVSLSDRELLDRMFGSSNGDKIERLYIFGDTSRYGGDSSSADLALCSHLAFWTGADPARMDTFFRSSALMRAKWDEQRGETTYGQRTINTAIKSCHEVYSPSGRRVQVEGPRTWTHTTEMVNQETGEVTNLPAATNLWPYISGAVTAPDWVINGVLLGGMVTLLHGEPGCGKTILALGFAVELVRKGLPVLFIDEESGAQLVGSRLRLMGITEEESNLIYYYPFEGFKLSDADTLLTLVDGLQPALVAFDSMADVLSASSLDENDAGDVTKWMVGIAARIARLSASQPAVLILDHNTKSTENVKFARGSGAKKAKSDVSFYVNKVNDFDMNTVGRVRLERTKNRPGVVPENLTYTIGGEDNSLVCRPFDISQDEIESGDSMALAALGALADAGPEGLGNQQLQGVLGLGHSKVSALMVTLEKQGKVARTGAGRVVRYLSLLSSTEERNPPWKEALPSVVSSIDRGSPRRGDPGVEESRGGWKSTKNGDDGNDNDF